MSRQSPVLDSVRGWVSGHLPGTIFTPTQMVRDLDKVGIKASSGATCQVLKELVERGRAVKVAALGSEASRGAYKLLPAAPAPSPAPRLLLSLNLGPDLSALPPEQRQTLEALKAQASAALSTYEAFLGLFMASAAKRKTA